MSIRVGLIQAKEKSKNPVFSQLPSFCGSIVNTIYFYPIQKSWFSNSEHNQEEILLEIMKDT